MSEQQHMRRQLTTDEYVQGVLRGDRAILGRAITLIESDAPRHATQAQELLQRVLPSTGRSIRVGITGVPGVGKSTLIETLGTRLCERGLRLAVLTVDPSSSLSHGSILGDKTRMERLSRMQNAFIRPSPTGGALGGVTRKTRESILICEAAGFEVILVETVGVGQSEIAVHAMTDCFVLLALAGAGDELQALKKGVVELADLIVITKADGPNRERVLNAKADYMRALRYLTPTTGNWRVPVLVSSAQTGEGIDQIWATIEEYRALAEATGTLLARRQVQTQQWFDALLMEALQRYLYANPQVSERLPQLRQAVVLGQIPVVRAVEEVLQFLQGPLPAFARVDQGDQ